MGACCTGSSSTKNRFTQATGEAAQAYFHLEGLPLCVSTTPAGQSSLVLRIVGLDCRDLLPRLEIAFLRRGLIVRHAKLVMMKDHYMDLTFQLNLKADDTMLSPFRPYSGNSTPPTHEVSLSLAKVNAGVVTNEVLEGEACINGAKEVLELKVKAPCKVGVRVGLADAVRKTGHRICCGILKTLKGMKMNDRLWLLPANFSSERYYDEAELRDLESLFLEAARQSLREGLGFDECAARREAKVGGLDIHQFNTPPAAYAAQKSADLVCALSEQNARKNLLKMKNLPKSLRSMLKKLEYPIYGPKEEGLQIPSFFKYTGIGLTMRSRNYSGEQGGYETGSAVQLVLELRTLFVRDQPPNTDIASRLQSWMSVEKGYAEFVSWLDVQQRTWTIYMVFLNDVLPKGKKLGEQAIAEHLLAPPELFFLPSSKDEAQGKGVDGSLMGSILESIPTLQMVRVCDVVNWNTYMLISIAASPGRSCSVIFGESMEWVLEQELRNSRMPRDVLKNGSILEVFSYTCLGKLVNGALATFNSKRKVQIKMVEAWAKQSEGYEIIHGEMRCRMNIEIKLECANDEVCGPSGAEQRLALCLESFERLDTIGAHDERRVIEGLDRFSAEQAMKSFGVPSPRSHSKSTTAASDSGTLETNDQLEREVNQRNVSWKIPPSTPEQGRLQLQPMAAIAGAMCRVLHHLQQERVLSCLAVTNATIQQEDGHVISTMGKGLQEKRMETDRAFSAVLGAIQLAFKSKVTGNVESMFRDSIEVFQEVSLRAMLQRPVIDAACARPPEKWMHRYLVCCCGETGYHELIVRVSTWILQVVKHLQGEFGVAASKLDRHQIMSVVKEHLGHQRSLIAAKGNSRLEQDSGKQTWLKLVAGACRLRDVWGSASSNSPGLEEELSQLLKHIDSLHACVMREASEEAFSVPRELILQCFDRLTLFIGKVDEVIIDELDDIIDRTPGSCCFPSDAYLPDTCLQDWAQREPAAGGLLSTEIAELVEDFRDGRIKQVAVLSGAGISVSANLPDFRSPGGLYDQMRKQGIASPESVFTADFMVEHPNTFYKVMKQLRTEDICPTLTHCFIRLLQDKGLLTRCYTQNIDGLERKVGIHEQKLTEAHGTLNKVLCAKCNREHPEENLYQSNDSDGIPRCEGCKGLLRPDIVFFGENLHWNYPELKADLGNVDLVIIMGTSLMVNPFASIVNLIKNGCAILVVNRFMPKTLLSVRRRRAMAASLRGKPAPRKEAFMQGDCDTSLQWLANELGWKDEMEGLLKEKLQKS